MHKLGKYKEAIDCYEKVLQINPNIGQIWYNKGESIEKMKKGGAGAAACSGGGGGC
jgi:tetratricopeptide (TPR) repeat protein